jgi:hypothetical protein
MRKGPESVASFRNPSLATTLTDKMVNTFSFTSGSFSGFKHVTRMSPTVCRCGPSAEPGKQLVTHFPCSSTLFWKVNKWHRGYLSAADGYLPG